MKRFELKTLIEPFGIMQFYTDGWGAYRRHLDQLYTVGSIILRGLSASISTLRLDD